MKTNQIANLNIVTRKISELKPHPRNPRVHPNPQIEKLQHSIDVYGYAKGSVVVQKSTDYILSGHGIIDALEREGYIEVDAVILDIPEGNAEAWMIADNKLGDDSIWDNEGLNELLAELNEMPDLDIEDTGFDLDELEHLLNDNASVEEDNFDVDEALQEEPITQTGDLWILGSHRVLCGDILKEKDRVKLLNGDKIDILLTDPPYGIKRDKGFEGFGGFGGLGDPIARRQYNDDWDSERPSKDCFDILLEMADKVLIFGGNYFADLLPRSTHWLVWDKLNTMPTFGDCELLWTNLSKKSVKKITFEYNGLLGKEDERFHPTQKPVGLLFLILKEIEGYSICDPFLGSGTTLIACEDLGRKCMGLEISPLYVDVICQRYFNLTGQIPVREADGFEFPCHHSE